LDESFEGAGVAAPFGVMRVGLVFGDMDMQDGLELAAKGTRVSDRFVGDGKRGMESHQTSHQGTLVRSDETPALRQPLVRFLSPTVTLGGPVAEERPHAELLTGVGQDIEGPSDEVR
jgi:hypothetical protein